MTSVSAPLTARLHGRVVEGRGDEQRRGLRRVGKRECGWVGVRTGADGGRLVRASAVGVGEGAGLGGMRVEGISGGPHRAAVNKTARRAAASVLVVLYDRGIVA